MKITKLSCASKVEALEWIRQQRLTGFGMLQWLHDDDCPAIASQRDADCCPPCHPDLVLIEPFAESAEQAKAVLN